MKTRWARTIRVLEARGEGRTEFPARARGLRDLEGRGDPDAPFLRIPPDGSGPSPGPRSAGERRGRHQDRLAPRHPQVRRGGRRVFQGRGGGREPDLRRHAEEGRRPQPGRRDDKAVRRSIRGFLVAEKVDFENVGFGSEILLGLRNSRDFGPVLTMGSGGLDVEYMNDRLKEGKAVAIASAHLLDEAKVRELLEPLAFFGKLAAVFRGRKPLVSPRVLGRYVPPLPRAGRRLFGFLGDDALRHRGGRGQPVRRPPRPARPAGRRLPVLAGQGGRPGPPVRAIGRLLKPATIGIIGVSEKMNIGHIILNNILKGRLRRREASSSSSRGAADDRRLPVRSQRSRTCRKRWTFSS